MEKFSDFGLKFSDHLLKGHPVGLRLRLDSHRPFGRLFLACIMDPKGVQHEMGAAKSVRAAQYVRMSTEHQKYSTENQSEAIAAYAARRGFDVVRTYTDAGKSGLRLDGRAALQELIADVRNGAPGFEAILVYDVSRWGRFQDADESAYYEFICREAGLSVHYCAEQFENDGSLSATIIKSMKRAMAGEYSRELSAKVFAGQCRLITLGFRQGGAAGYLNTMFKGVPMSLKSIDSVRSAGPDVVIAVVRWSVGQFSPPDGSIVPASDDRMTLVFRRSPAGLQLVHGANVQINAIAEQFDPSKGPPPTS